MSRTLITQQFEHGDYWLEVTLNLDNDRVVEVRDNTSVVIDYAADFIYFTLSADIDGYVNGRDIHEYKAYCKAIYDSILDSIIPAYELVNKANEWIEQQIQRGAR